MTRICDFPPARRPLALPSPQDLTQPPHACWLWLQEALPAAPSTASDSSGLRLWKQHSAIALARTFVVSLMPRMQLLCILNLNRGSNRLFSPFICNIVMHKDTQRRARSRQLLARANFHLPSHHFVHEAFSFGQCWYHLPQQTLQCHPPIQMYNDYCLCLLVCSPCLYCKSSRTDLKYLCFTDTLASATMS